MADQPRNAAEFMVDAPLYTEYTTSVTALPVGLDELYPKTVSRDCDRCRLKTIWDRNFAKPTHGELSAFGEVNYFCRNCRQNIFHVFFSYTSSPAAKTVTYKKHGQYPQLEIDPPPVLKKALGKHLGTYRSGKTLRHHGYGVGSLIYFRRLVEDTTNEMLDLLAEALADAGTEEAAIQQIKAAKDGRIFEDKVKLAADLLPTHLRPGGVNPFGLLYDLLSRGIHRLSDEQCCTIVDRMEVALTFIFKELKANAEERREYANALKELQKPQTSTEDKPTG